VGDLAEAECEIANEVNRGDDFEHRQLRDRSKRMGRERDRARAGPRPLERHVLEVIFDELADARAAVDVRNDLEQKIRRRERGADRGGVGHLVLVTHGRGDDAHRSIVQRSDHLVDLDMQRRVGQFFRKAPKLTPACDRRLVVEEHAMAVAALAAAKAHRNDLSGFGVVAEPGGVRHADEFVLDEGLVHFERLRNDRAQFVRVRSIGDDHEFAVDETVRAGRIGRACQRHGEGARLDLCFLHVVLLCEFSRYRASFAAVDGDVLAPTEHRSCRIIDYSLRE